MSEISTLKAITVIICSLLIANLFSSVVISYSVSDLPSEEKPDGEETEIIASKSSSEMIDEHEVKLLASDMSGVTIELTIDEDDLTIEPVDPDTH